MKHTGRALCALLCLILLLSGCSPQGEQPSVSAAPSPALPQESEAAPVPEETVPPVSEAPEEPELLLWMTRDCPLTVSLTAYADEYREQSVGTPLRIRVFDDEETMREAMRTERPDLLLCDSRLAAQLAGEGELSSALPWPELLPLFQADPAVCGGGFAPLGAELPVLITRQDTLPRVADCASLEALCAKAVQYAREQGRPFLSADSFSQIFADALAQRGCPFYAMREQDLENEAFRDVYNLLADTAFEGGLVSADGPVLTLVAGGELACGICSSREVLGAEQDGLLALPLPPMEGCEALVETRIWGIALAADGQEAALDFLGWLNENGRAQAAALDSLLVPAAPGDWSDYAGTAADGLLHAAEVCRPYLPEADGFYARNGAKFEQSFRAALALLG